MEVDLTKKISDALSIPTRGIGAGSYTDAQIMVIHDMLGIKTLPKQPKFVKNFLAESNSIAEALEAYVKAVKSVSFPSQEHWFE